jgi:hypothetical protein
MKIDLAMLGTSGYGRQPLDQYFTPGWVTQALTNRVHFRDRIWEPACGRGDMSLVLRDAGYDVFESDIVGTALGCVGARQIDFLDTTLRDGVQTIATNPPYTAIEPFIRHALRLTRDCGGIVAMLARHEYDCAARRCELFGYPFALKLTLTRRPRWFDDGIAAPRHNFDWYVWDWSRSASAPATLDWARS